jgi:5,5'-dehydrodivanillate O-demethylase oxygenase subunit
MGELMRRYWQPVLAAAQLVELPVQKVRVLGENLVVFRDAQNRLGALAEACGHRGISLRFGIPDDEGLRCGYDGWLYDSSGRCLDTPGESDDEEFKGLLRIRGYSVQELGGLVWVYLGPDPAPLLPRWDVFVWEHAFRQIGATLLPCNWLQCMENAVDPMPDDLFASALEHASMGRPTADAGRRRFPLVDFERYEHGILRRRLSDASQQGAPDLRDPVVFPMMVRLGSGFRNELQIRVPVDDTHTWHVVYQCFLPGPDVDVPKQDVVPFYEVPLQDEKGEFVRECRTQEKMAIWVSQGEIVDRSRENLVPSDRGILLYRRLLTQQMAVVEDGGEPINVLRDPERNRRIDLQPSATSEDHVTRIEQEAAEDVERYSPLRDQFVELYDKYRSAVSRRTARAEG